MRRVVPLACLVLLAWGCKKTDSTATPTPPEKPIVPPPAAATSETLNGAAIAQSKDGPWIVRGPAAGGPGAPAMLHAMADKSGRGGAEGGIGGLGSGGGPGGGGPPGAMVMPAPSAPRALAAKEKRAFGDSLAEPAAAEPGEDGSPEKKGAPKQALQAEAAPLRAGSTDDNAEFAQFLQFFSSWSDRPETAGKADLLDVKDRRFIKVTDAQGRPVPSARVNVVDVAKDQVVWAATSYGDGRVPYYPRLAAPGAKLVVEASLGEQRARASWDGAADLTLPLPGERPSAPIQLDVLFAIDTTGSMQDEIDRIKDSLAGVTEKLKGLKLEFDLRYSAVLFRDLGDAYVTSTYPFTSDLAAFARALQAVNAAGGGDLPESVNQGLAEAVRADWRPGAAKVVFLIGDAPPHMDYQGDVPYGQSLKAAVARGVRIHSVAASGLDPLGTLVWRQVAQFTRGRFIFIEYGGSVAATAESHGVAGAVKSNNLDDILFEQIRDELAYWGKDGPAPAVAGQ